MTNIINNNVKMKSELSLLRPELSSEKMLLLFACTGGLSKCKYDYGKTI